MSRCACCRRALTEPARRTRRASSPGTSSAGMSVAATHRTALPSLSARSARLRSLAVSSLSVDAARNPEAAQYSHPLRDRAQGSFARPGGWRVSRPLLQQRLGASRMALVQDNKRGARNLGSRSPFLGTSSRLDVRPRNRSQLGVLRESGQVVVVHRHDRPREVDREAVRVLTGKAAASGLDDAGAAPRRIAPVTSVHAARRSRIASGNRPWIWSQRVRQVDELIALYVWAYQWARSSFSWSSSRELAEGRDESCEGVRESVGLCEVHRRQVSGAPHAPS